MVKKDKNYVMERVKEENVRFIRLWFTDILGFLKSFSITVEELENTLEDGSGFDGSSIQGFVRIDESDMVALPDPSTFIILPWQREEDVRIARMFCDIVNPDGTPYSCDPRYVLKRNLKEVKDMGYTFNVGPELEYFYFKDSSPSPEPMDRGGYFDLTPLDVASNLRKETVLLLESMGIGVEYSHHEVAPSQHEIDLRYTDALTMADSAMTYRLVVKEVALKHNIYATFMPKPLFGENGNGMHTHMSLFKGDNNAFFEKEDEFHLSELGKKFIAGLLKHAREITLVTNQWVNSYKRLVPGYEAPIYITWARRNRSDLIRVPQYKPGREKSTRVEYRSPDPACNPYLAFTALLAAGVAGIKNDYELPPPVEKNVYEMSKAEREAMGISVLPDDLYEAIQCAAGSELLKKTLGEEMFTKFIDNKKLEWEEYRAQVSKYELERYLPVL